MKTGVVVATFRDTSPPSTPFYIATINWDDGTPTKPDITTGDVGTGTAGSFTVTGSHQYNVVRKPLAPYDITVEITDIGASNNSVGKATSSAVVTNPKLGIIPGGTISIMGRTATLRNFIFTGPPLASSGFKAKVTWGDSLFVNTAQIQPEGQINNLASFLVTAAHTYQKAGNFPLVLTINYAVDGDSTTALTISLVMHVN
jgi:hypothetical protein